jgi:hypothetical protein
MGINRYPPPPRDFFRHLPVRGDAPDLGVEVGTWIYRLEGLDPALRADLLAHYRPFITPARGEGCHRARVLEGGADHFLPPDGVVRPRFHPLTLGWEGNLLKVRSYGFVGWVSLEEAEGEIALARSEYERGEWSVENYLRICTAWKAVREGGVLLHGASLVRSGKAWIFIGPSGSGKSTLARSARGGQVVSDDLTLVRRSPSGFRVEATPFRGTYQGGEPVKGSFPVGGICRILQSTENRISPCPPDQAMANLLASSPFVVDQLERSPEILGSLRTLNVTHPVSYLHFSLDGDFWDVLRDS